MSGLTYHEVLAALRHCGAECAAEGTPRDVARRTRPLWWPGDDLVGGETRAEAEVLRGYDAERRRMRRAGADVDPGPTLW